jgi:hypothetical protein
MSIDAEFHADIVLVLPHLSVVAETCGNRECLARHYTVSIGWLFGSLHICLSW